MLFITLLQAYHEVVTICNKNIINVGVNKVNWWGSSFVLSPSATLPSAYAQGKQGKSLIIGKGFMGVYES